MEYASLKYAFCALIGFIFWAMNYFYILKKAELYLPKKFTKSSGKFLKLVLFLIGIISWTYIGYALTGPKIPLGKTTSPVEANDIFFVVDVSRSMYGMDFKPNRLEVAKKSILKFVDMMPKDRIGLIIFGQQVYTLLPLTTDLKLIKEMVKKIDVGFLGGGTNIGDSLGLAIARSLKSIAKNRIIILLTDGVSNYESITPVAAAAYAKDKNIKIYAIGIGGNKNALYPNERGQITSIPGKSFDMEVLKTIAEMTDGKAYRANSEGALQEVFSSIERLERSEQNISGKVVYKQLYHKYMIIGIMLLLLVEILRRILLREGP